MSTPNNCNKVLRESGKAYPRTCQVCGLGPCHHAHTLRPATPADNGAQGAPTEFTALLSTRDEKANALNFLSWDGCDDSVAYNAAHQAHIVAHRDICSFVATLAAERDRLRDALEPLAKVAEKIGPNRSLRDTTGLWAHSSTIEGESFTLTVGDARRAHAALTGTAPSETAKLRAEELELIRAALLWYRSSQSSLPIYNACNELAAKLSANTQTGEPCAEVVELRAENEDLRKYAQESAALFCALEVLIECQKSAPNSAKACGTMASKGYALAKPAGTEGAK